MIKIVDYLNKKQLFRFLRAAGDFRKICRYIKQDIIDRGEMRRLIRMLQSEGISSVCQPDSGIHWGAVLKYRKRLDRSEYAALCRNIFKINEEAVRKKSLVKICFVTSLETTWSGDRICQLLEQSGRFQPFIAIADAEAEERSAEERKEYYLSRGLRAYTFTELGDVKADVFIYQNPYPLANRYADIKERRVSELCVMIPYAVFLGQSKENYLEAEWFARSQCMWRFYCYTKIQREQGRKNNILGDINMVYSGYPKMDALLSGHYDGTSWAFGKDAVRRIIYAPSLYWEYSTFMKSWKLMYELAEEYPQIAWIFRPHPYLGYTLVRDRQIPEIGVYERYLQSWDELENACVQKGGDYYDTIMTSDAMIADLTSLISNYQYTGKPLLVLKDDDMEFSEYGQELVSVQYTADGADKEAVRRFINDVVLEGRDDSRAKREAFFDDNLNYLKENGQPASDYIYNDIVGALS